jgi:hypothetical protein
LQLFTNRIEVSTVKIKYQPGAGYEKGHASAKLNRGTLGISKLLEGWRTRLRPWPAHSTPPMPNLLVFLRTVVSRITRERYLRQTAGVVASWHSYH